MQGAEEQATILKMRMREGVMSSFSDMSLRPAGKLLVDAQVTALHPGLTAHAAFSGISAPPCSFAAGHYITRRPNNQLRSPPFMHQSTG